LGNIGSVKKMCEVAGADVVIVRTPEDLAVAERIILPGVGAFDEGISRLKDAGLFDSIRLYSNEKQRPILGICLGMQMLGEGSEEGALPGLGLIPSRCLKFKDDIIGCKVPHMGWNTLLISQDHPVFQLSDSARFYFVHSYFMKCTQAKNVIAACKYGVHFTAAVANNNVIGVQFHPEKSHRFGLALMEKFIGWEP
jgi:glutamine amidotransferase